MSDSALLKASRKGDFAAADAVGWKLTSDEPWDELGYCLYVAAAHSHEAFLKQLCKRGRAQLTPKPGLRSPYRSALNSALITAVCEKSCRPLELLLTQIKMPSSSESAELLFWLAAGDGRRRNLELLLKHVSPSKKAACCQGAVARALSTHHLNIAKRLVNVLVELGTYADQQSAWKAIDEKERHTCLELAAGSRRMHILRWALAQGFENGKDCLGEAASKNWIEGVKLLLDSGIDPNHPQSDALINATGHDNVEMAQLLIDAGITIGETRDLSVLHFLQTPWSPLMQAAWNGSPDVLKLLLSLPEPHTPKLDQLKRALDQATESGNAEVAAILEEAVTRLEPSAATDGNVTVAAALSGNRELWEKAIKEGIKPDLRNDFGKTPLHGAASSGMPETVRQLINAGASLDARDDNGQTPLHRAVRFDVYNSDPNYKPSEVIRLLLEAGAEIDAQDDLGRTPLAESLWGGTMELTQALLVAGADVMGKRDPSSDYASDSPLHVATIQQGPEAIAILVAAGADVNAADSIGRTSLHVAARGDTIEECLRALLSHGADPNRRDSSGQTPLHIAAADKRLAAVEALLEFGADADAQDLEGNTPLIVRCKEKYFAWDAHKVVTILLAAGADPHHRNSRGLTALDFAKKRRDMKEVAKLLVHATRRD